MPIANVWKQLGLGFVLGVGLPLLVPMYGCASDEQRVCGKPTGTYRYHYTEQSGNCGPIDDGIGPVDGPGSVPDGEPDPITGTVCRRNVQTTEDECRSEGALTCVFTDGRTVQFQTVLDRYDGGAFVEGTVQVTAVRDGVMLCTELYDFTARRQ